VDFETIEAARQQALSGGPPAKHKRPRGNHLRRRAGKLFVGQAKGHQ
jgi:hypothetical protein